MAGDRITRITQCLDDFLEGQLVVVEFDGDGVCVHVGRDGIRFGDLRDGRTGPRRGTASDDTGRLKDVLHRRCVSTSGR
jgi:hypothetical protein